MTAALLSYRVISIEQRTTYVTVQFCQTGSITNLTIYYEKGGYAQASYSIEALSGTPLSGQFVYQDSFALTEAGGIMRYDIFTGILQAGSTYRLTFDVCASGDFDTYESVILANINPVPEPGTMLLLGFGLMGVVGLRKKFLNN